MKSDLLHVRDLTVGFKNTSGKTGLAVNGLDFSIKAGKTLSLVGESGCGKSMTALALMRLLPENAQCISGTAFFKGKDLFKMSGEQLTEIRGNSLSMIFQDPMSSLNPVMKVGQQVAEPLRWHRGYTRQMAHDAVVELFNRVGIPHAAERAHDYPHQLSGGMRQRVMIAQALACQPELLIADEPTTALDVTVQKQILEIVYKLVHETGSGMLLISHDLSVVSACADEVAVMYAGIIVEQGAVDAVLQSPLHPYTKGLLSSRVSLLDDGVAHAAPGTGSRQLAAITGTVPSIWQRPAGCVFHPRCVYAMPVCSEAEPTLDSEAARLGRHVCRCFLCDE